VKGEGAGVGRGRDAGDTPPALVPRDGEEALVELTAEARTALVRAHAHEVDVCLVRLGLREEADEEAGQLAVALGHE
jgi:hypothetical protein